MKVIDSIYLGDFIVKLDLVETDHNKKCLLVTNKVDGTQCLIAEKELNRLLMAINQEVKV